jgi:ferric-dicitrate binding protein FerR (iron transport regulator)
MLDTAARGTIAKQGSARIVKTDSGKLSYQSADAKRNQTIAIEYNTLSTPRGGQYQLTLPDGSQVWLNAASSIRYPIAFAGGERHVDITGEVYFEVMKNASQPFKVSINGRAEVEVLGTHFNINAYEDESSINTTLLEGSVQISSTGSTPSREARVPLKPGQQAQYKNAGSIQIIDHADTEQAIAWKNGRFAFNNSDLKTIMRQIARWYDVDVVYEGSGSPRYFTADLSRNRNLSVLLQILEQSKLHFNIDGKRLTVIQ